MKTANSTLDGTTRTGAPWTETTTNKSLVVPVLRDERFQRYNPDYFTVTRTSTDTLEKFELRLQSLAHREMSHQLNLGAGDGLGIVGREVRVEVTELAAIVMTARQMTKLRDNLSQAIAGAAPQTEDAAKDRLARLAGQIEVAETELARRAWQMRGWENAAPDRSDFASLSARVDALAEQVAPHTEQADAAAAPIAAWAFLGKPAPAVPRKAAFGRTAAWAGLGTFGLVGMLLILAVGHSLVWPMQLPAVRAAASPPIAAAVADARPARAETNTPLPPSATQSAVAAQSPEPAPVPPAPPPVIASAPAPLVARSGVAAGAQANVEPAVSLAKLETPQSPAAVTSEAVAVPLPLAAEKANPAAQPAPATAPMPSKAVAIPLPSLAEKAKPAARPTPVAAPMPSRAVAVSLPLLAEKAKPAARAAPAKTPVPSKAVAVPLSSAGEKAKPAGRPEPAAAPAPSGAVAASLPSIAEKAKLAARPAPAKTPVPPRAVAVPMPSAVEKAKLAGRPAPAAASMPSGAVAVSLPLLAENAKPNARPASAAAPAPYEAIFASAASWVHVWNAAGINYISRVLKPGETWPVPAVPGLQMTTGNAGSTYLVVDGVKGQPLGPSGAVRSEAIAPPASPGARDVTAAARPNPG